MERRTGRFILRHLTPFDVRYVSPDLMYPLIPWILLIYVCFFFAHIDLIVSSYFFDSISERFTYHNHPLTVLWHEAARYVTITVIMFVLAVAAVKYGDRKRIAFMDRVPHVQVLRGVSAASLWFVVMVWVIGPGLIINSGLKEHAGRARPHQITLFGGEKLFTPAFYPANQCESNCSFSSGDPASGFALYAFAAIDKRRRGRWLLLSLLTGALFGTTRIMQGKHFLSDVIATAFIIYTVMHMLRRIKPFRHVFDTPQSSL